MSEQASQMMALLCSVVRSVPVGTNLALLHLLWMLVSGQLLLSRGAVIPGLAQLGLSPRAVRRAWQALRQGGWSIGQLLVNWEAALCSAGQWHVRYHSGYCAVAIDTTGFGRPRLQNCPSTHYDQQAGKALPAIVLGIIGRVGQVGKQRLLLPLGILRVAPAQPTEAGLIQTLIISAKNLLQAQDVLVSDGGFPLEVIQTAKVPRYVAKQARNMTARRDQPPEYEGKGRPAERGALVRPLSRTYKDHVIAATAPDRTEEWQAEGVTVRADLWDHLVLTSTRADALAEAPRFTVLVIHDPRFTKPLVLATNLTLAAQTVCALYRDRWPVEQMPLAAKQMIGAVRAFVFAQETCQRLPELALLAGAILSYAAACLPAIPTGFWDRHPQPTPGRLRRFLARVGFPTDYPLPPEIRQKASVTDHLPKGASLFRRIKGSAAPV
jgi:hypothetical protein